jgi:hypothetical protein
MRLWNGFSSLRIRTSGGFLWTQSCVSKTFSRLRHQEIQLSIFKLSLWRSTHGGNQNRHIRDLFEHTGLFSVRLPNQGEITFKDALELDLKLVPLYRILMLRYSDSVLNSSQIPAPSLQTVLLCNMKHLPLCKCPLSLQPCIVGTRIETHSRTANFAVTKTLFKGRFNYCSFK